MEDETQLFNMMNEPIRISDASSMLRHYVSPNERPYKATVMIANNKLIDEWHDKVLKQICDKRGFIKSGQVLTEWEYFYNGKIIKHFINYLNKGLIIRPNKDIVDYWVKTFEESTVEELNKLESPLIGYAWKLLNDEIYIRKCLDRWEFVYSQSEDPLIWRKLANNNPKLWNFDHENPFWGPQKAEEINYKIMAIISTPIQSH